MSAMSIIHCAITIIALSLYSRRSSTIISHVHSPFSGSRGFDKFLFTCTTIKITLCLSSESVACYEKLGLASNKLSLPDKNKSLYVWLLIYWVSTIVNCGLWYISGHVKCAYLMIWALVDVHRFFLFMDLIWYLHWKCPVEISLV